MLSAVPCRMRAGTSILGMSSRKSVTQVGTAALEANQEDVGEVEGVQHGLEVRREGVVVVAGRGLARPPEAAAVVGDDAVPGLEQRRALLLPGVPVEGVAVDEDDRLTFAVVLVVEVD